MQLLRPPNSLQKKFQIIENLLKNKVRASIYVRFIAAEPKHILRETGLASSATKKRQFDFLWKRASSAINKIINHLCYKTHCKIMNI